jgi:hypothetical protein
MLNKKHPFICLKFLLAVGLWFFFTACKQPIKTQEALNQYISDPHNNLQQTQETNGVKVTLTYKPWQAFIRGTSNKANIKKYSNRYFFVLSLSAHDKELLRQLDFDTYSNMVQVLSFRMIPLIHAIPDNGKPVEPMDCIFQQTYGTATANNLLIVFDKDKLLFNKKLNIVINEFGLNLGTLQFQFNANDFKEIPDINI